MAHYFAIHDSTGRIRQSGYATSQAGSVAAPDSDLTAVEVAHRPDLKTEWIDGDVLTARPTFDAFDTLAIAADGVAAATLANLPTGTVVTIDAQSWTINDGSFVFKTTTPATYDVQVRLWPYQDYDVEIVAT